LKSTVNEQRKHSAELEEEFVSLTEVVQNSSSEVGNTLVVKEVKVGVEKKSN